MNEAQKLIFKQAVEDLLGAGAWRRLKELTLDLTQYELADPLTLPITSWTNEDLNFRLTWKETKQGHEWWNERVWDADWNYYDKVDPEIYSILVKLEHARTSAQGKQIKEEEWL